MTCPLTPGEDIAGALLLGFLFGALCMPISFMLIQSGLDWLSGKRTERIMRQVHEEVYGVRDVISTVVSVGDRWEALAYCKMSCGHTISVASVNAVPGVMHRCPYCSRK